MPKEEFTPKLEPMFDFSLDKPNCSIYGGEAQVCVDGEKYLGTGEVRLDFYPKARIFCYGYFQDVPVDKAMNMLFRQKNIDSFSVKGRKIDGFVVSSGGDSLSQEYNLKWSPRSEPVQIIGDEVTAISYCIFHLFNFEDYHGTRRTIEEKDGGSCAIEHLDLTYDKWQVELKSLVSTNDVVKLLKNEGGYRLTHVGLIQRIDGECFSGQDLKAYLSGLRMLFSFSKGAWCDPVCPVGQDGQGGRVWESWSSPQVPWKSLFSWFDYHNGMQLQSLFPLFMKRWSNEDWKQTLHEVIYWYLNANDSGRGIDAGIILTQAAIERLSYELVVKDKRLLLTEGFKNLWASDKFRLLFSSLDIPLEIPIETPELQKMAQSGVNWLDAPHALTEIRNTLVHPEHKKRGQFRKAYFEAWNLGLWYLEMSILAVCKYQGTYGNRLKSGRYIGQVEEVPWNKS